MEVLEKLIKERQQIKSGDDKAYSINAKRIRTILQLDGDTLPIDLILGAYSHLGHAPNLLYDDNGFWCVSSSGIQPVVMGDERLDNITHVIHDLDSWKPTIREAVIYYIEN